MSKYLLSVIAASALVCSTRSTYAFDTFWHSAASAGAGQQHQFSADAVNVLQFGTFGPDFFGPLYDTVLGKRVETWEKKEFWQFMLGLGGKNPNVRKAGTFMHFDNLYGELDRDWKIDYLFRRLLDNTQRTLATFYKDGSLNEGNKKIVILITLGAALHMVEDFYSHSDWTHFDYIRLGFPQQQSVWHQDYAPTWFQVVAKLGPPAADGYESWPIEPRTGLYPVIDEKHTGFTSFGLPMSHTAMNHDNSQLFYDGASQIRYHGFGAHPARDQASATAHQLYAINSGAMAANEFVDLVEQDADAKAAIEYAHDWDLRKYNRAMQQDLESGLTAVLFFSCFKNKWDGDHPPKARANECLAWRSGISLPTLNEFWGAYVNHNILEKLTQGFGSPGGHYQFDAIWYRNHRPQPKPAVKTDLVPLGLQVDAPPATTATPGTKSVKIEGPFVGTIELTVAPAQTVDQAKQEAQKEGGTQVTQEPADPGDFVLVYRIPSAGHGLEQRKVRAQRKIGKDTYSCIGTGTVNQARQIADTCKGVHLDVE